SPSRAHQFLSSFTGGGGVELAAGGYERQTLASKTAAADTTKHQFELDAQDISFGTAVEISDQRVKAAIYYVQVGGDDTTPENDLLWIYDDGKIDLKLTAAAAEDATTLLVEPIGADLRDGAEIEFSGGA